MPTINPKANNLWLTIEKARASNLRFAVKLIRKALNLQIKPVLDLLPEIIPDSIAEQVQDYDIKEAVREIYVRAGSKFGRAVFSSLQKAEFSEQSFLLFVNMIMEQQAGDLIKNITATTKDRIKRILQLSYASGLSVPDTAKLIQKKLTAMTLARSVSIARTEIIRASNMGALAGAKMTGLDLKKEWISTLDDRTRTEPFDHVTTNGQIVGIDEKFDVSGEELAFPVDFTGSPGNTINCRCVVAFISV